MADTTLLGSTTIANYILGTDSEELAYGFAPDITITICPHWHVKIELGPE